MFRFMTACLIVFHGSLLIVMLGWMVLIVTNLPTDIGGMFAIGALMMLGFYVLISATACWSQMLVFRSATGPRALFSMIGLSIFGGVTIVGPALVAAVDGHFAFAGACIGIGVLHLVQVKYTYRRS